VISLVRPIRSASISGYLELAKAVGLDGESMMREVGLSPNILQHIDTLVPIDAVCQLLENSAVRSGYADFAIQLLDYRKFSNLGPISLVLLDELTPRTALQTLVRYLQVINPALRIEVQERQDQVLICEDLVGIRPNLRRQSIELALAVMFKILQQLIGLNWKPLRISFNHACADDGARHQAFFGCSVRFNEPFSAITCRSNDLLTSNRAARLGLATYARSYLDQALQHDHQSPSQTVRQLIELLLPSGKCSATQIAELLSVDRRTLQRYLLTEKTTYSMLLNEVRLAFVRAHLQADDKSLVEMTKLLGFSGQSAFGHWFRMTFGESVTQWRYRENQ
jgi:AraC-like DNA-binding protein